jgi:D-alanyl-D-alanine dipeptidase
MIAANQSRAQGNTLVFWDCYRPHNVQVRMFQAVPNPNWVARPRNYARSHEAGRSVDVTIAGIDMGTDFDDFTPRGLAYATTDAPDPRRSGQLSDGGQSRQRNPTLMDGGLAPMHEDALQIPNRLVNESASARPQHG